MRRSFIFGTLLALQSAASLVFAQNVCGVLAGSSIVAKDGTFLGQIENPFSTRSTLNEYGTYGGHYSAKSIWNEYGTYGGEYSAQSPFNPYSSTPPMVIKNNQVIAYLTVNQSMRGSLNPYVLKTCQFY